MGKEITKEMILKYMKEYLKTHAGGMFIAKRDLANLLFEQLYSILARKASDLYY